MENTNFTQLCVWPGTVVGQEKVAEFELYMLQEFQARVKYLTELKTNPDICEEHGPIEGTGGRNDLFFYVHADDISSFALPRLQAGIRWWEDVIKYNDNSKHLYPASFIKEHPATW